MKVHFKTNLDEPQPDVWDLNERWPKDAPLPRVGERILFVFDGNRKFELEVCSVAFNYAANEAQVELHMPSYYGRMSINEWAEWFKRHRSGRSVEPFTSKPEKETSR